MQSQINNSTLNAELASIYGMFVESNIFPVAQALELQGKYKLDSYEKQDKAVRDFASAGCINRSHIGDFHKMFTNGFGVISQFDSLVSDNNLKVSNAMKEQYEYIEQVIQLNEQIEQLKKEKGAVKPNIFPFIRRFSPDHVEPTKFQPVAPSAPAPSVVQALDLALKQKEEKIAALESHLLIRNQEAEERGETIYELEQLLAKLQQNVGKNDIVDKLNNEIKKQAEQIEMLKSAALVYKNEALERGELIFENEHLIASLQKKDLKDSNFEFLFQDTCKQNIELENLVSKLQQSNDEKDKQIEKIKLQFEKLIARYA